MNRIMLDLETFGTRPGSLIKAIGAVRFSVARKEITDNFYAKIDGASAQHYGLRIDAATVEWWLKQGDAARREMTAPGEPLPAVLDAFRDWALIRTHGGAATAVDEVWGNGASFDPVLLRCAFEACEIATPWPFWAERCYRTMKALFPSLERAVLSQDARVAHNALDDARSQAEHLMPILDRVLEAQR